MIYSAATMKMIFVFCILNFLGIMVLSAVLAEILAVLRNHPTSTPSGEENTVKTHNPAGYEE